MASKDRLKVYFIKSCIDIIYILIVDRRQTKLKYIK